jgi:hypothetical protein
MKRIVKHPRHLALAAGLIAIAGLAWGAGLRPQVDASAPESQVSAPAPVVASAPVPAPSMPARPAPASVVAAAPAAATAIDASVAGASGMRIFRDPETGEIGPPSAEALAALPQATPPPSNLVQVRLPDGSYMVDLQGHFQETMIMSIDANGRRTIECVTDPEAGKIVAPRAPVATAKREEK